MMNLMENREIRIGIYYYIDEEGNKVYDEEAMRDELESKLEELVNGYEEDNDEDI